MKYRFPVSRQDTHEREASHLGSCMRQARCAVDDESTWEVLELLVVDERGVNGFLAIADVSGR
jgi:hypothetical protein